VTEIKLRLDKWLEGVEIADGAIANLYPIGGAGSTTRKSRRGITIPAGYGSAFRTIEADPGRYLVEVRLPSGQTLSQEVEVLPPGLRSGLPGAEVRFKDEGSPHEWLSWQHFAGNVIGEERQVQQKLRDRGFYKGTIDGVFGPETNQALKEFQSANALPETGTLDQQMMGLLGLRGTGQGRAEIEATPFGGLPPHPDHERGWQWNAIADSLKKVPGEHDWLGRGSQVHPSNSDSTLQAFVLTAAQFNVPAQVPNIGEADLPGGRRVLTARFGDQIELVSLPIPWMSAGAECAIDVVVRNALDDPKAFRASVMVRDPTLGSAMSFMTAGGLSDAAVLFDRAKNLLFEKVENPLAAAAGAYVLVAAQQGPDRQTWHSWVKNLMNWFPWLPDGAIQYGRLKLRDEASDDDLEEARRVLFMAYHRGLPFFSAGIRWLLSGLTIFSEEGDAEAQKMAKAVHRVSLRTDMSQPFTVVRLGPRSS
jgi:Putative peptidoglycan binding domain